MHGITLKRALLVAFVPLALAACKKQTPDDPRLDLVLTKLETIDKRLAALEKRGVGPAGAPQAQRPRPDANTTYFVPVMPTDGVLGPANAKVTIIEAYEFA